MDLETAKGERGEMLRLLKWGVLTVVVALAALAVVLAVPVLRLPSRVAGLGEPAPVQPPLDLDRAAATLADIIRVPVISTAAGEADTAALDRLHALLAEKFPLTHATLTLEHVNGEALLFTWHGSDPTLPPLLLAAHQDVVPVEAGTEGDWRHPPFAGDIADGYIWGRGTLDDRSSLVAILEAVEGLLKEGIQPRRTLYLAFGQDEEVSGHAGAQQIAAVLRARGVRLDMAVDEGGLIGRGVIPGTGVPTAMVAVGEKGYATFKLEARYEGGHSSMPKPDSAATLLAAALLKVRNASPPPRLTPATRALLTTLAPDMPPLNRVVVANLWLTAPLVETMMAQSPAAAATLHTTYAPTVIRAGTKDNVLPQTAQALVNARLMPGDTVAAAGDRLRRAIADDRVAVSLESPDEAQDAPPVSDFNGRQFAVLRRTINQVSPDAVVVPMITTGATDDRYYADIAAATLRFFPARYTPADLARLHGTNERIGVENYGEVIRFYRQLIINEAVEGR